ncbi:MAG: sulfite exporter TauE/SafE family protein [Anaerolineales bacterium]|nr:sulfite exporter TauE/SafE family protein [Anaerolineales bacterium]
MELILPIIPLAFICELVDSSLGMGYGTTLTPLLLILGYDPLDVVPAVLFSEFITGILAGLLHHEFENVDLRPGTRDFKVMLVMTLLSIVGVVIAVLISVSLPTWAVKAYIGIVVLGIGISILLNHKRRIAFSWKRIAGLGLLASFNKGISGGGYGPVVTGGQVLAGMESRRAIAIASMAEGITSAVGVSIYLLSGVSINMDLASSLLIGAVLSVPLAAYFIKRVSMGRLTLAIGVMSTALGGYTLLRLFV